ncbi:MAG: fructose-bisphosphate aldolase, partial [Sedimenticolaceae bacterium]
MTDIQNLLGEEAEYLLEHRCDTIPRGLMHLPGPDFIDRVTSSSDRKVGVLRGLQTLFDHG